MALVTPWPTFRQALVRQLRANVPLREELGGDDKIAEGFMPQPQSAAGVSVDQFPFLVYALHYAPADYVWGGLQNIIGFDVFAFSRDQGQAGLLDQLVYDSLQDQKLTVADQTFLQCRRVSSLSLTDSDQSNRRIWQTGGVWEARMIQHFPTNRSLSVTLDSEIG